MVDEVIADYGGHTLSHSHSHTLTHFPTLSLSHSHMVDEVVADDGGAVLHLLQQELHLRQVLRLHNLFHEREQVMTS